MGGFVTLRVSRALLCAVVSSRLLYGQADDASRLPIQRVVLYKNGVGYFEHLGSVRGNQDVTISFTSGQLNDVLKSLTALDLNGGRIAGVAYGSAPPVPTQLRHPPPSPLGKTVPPRFLRAAPDGAAG